MTAAGTISQTARGFASFCTKSASEEAPIAFSLASSATASGDLSKTTHSWPPPDQPADHVRTHSPESNHSELHDIILR